MKKYQTYIAIGSLLSLMVVLITYGLMQDMQHLNPLESPNGQHWLGTDQLGRDFLVRLIVGSLVTLSLTGIVIKAAFIHLMLIINCAKKKALSEVCPEREHLPITPR
ncbi:hypothetical protein HMPREF9978_10543 [Staphylococcus epidermidis NIHLM015]|nr:hypothetical protein HMPREF9978_10543 [Staphylococcus epidermidis NIHLM015]